MKNLVRVGLFIDGGYFAEASSFYKYKSVKQDRLSLEGMVRYAEKFVRKECVRTMDYPPHCAVDVVVKQYYRGRFSALSTAQHNNLMSDRAWEEVLLLAGFQTRHYPCGVKGEKAIDVMFALDAFKAAANDELDAVVLVTGDEDFVPLCKELRLLGVPTFLMAWHSARDDHSPADAENFSASAMLMKEVNFYAEMYRVCDDSRESVRMFVGEGSEKQTDA